MNQIVCTFHMLDITDIPLLFLFLFNYLWIYHIILKLL